MQNESKHSEMGPVRQNPIQRTVSLFICVCIPLCTIVAHNIAQNRRDSFSPLPSRQSPQLRWCLFEGRGGIRRETRWNLLGCPKLTKRSQPLEGRSSPYCKDMWRRYCCLTSFLPIVDTCLSREDIARRSCAMVPRWRFLATFCVLFLQRAARSTFQTCILNSP